MATRAPSRRRKGETLHDGFLRHANFRWAKIATVLSAIAIVAYWLIDIRPRPNGGSWEGYILGTIGALLILWLTALGLRKRAMTKGRWSLKAWVSAHVYLGLSLIVIATLHTGFQLGWNVHTLAYALMMLVILSGMFGIAVYAAIPAALSRNREQMTQSQMLDALRSLDRQLHDAAQPLPHPLAAHVRASLEQDPFGGGLIRRITGSHPGCDTTRALIALRAASWTAQEEAMEKVDALLERKGAMLVRLRRHLKLKAWLEIWLYVHIPATFALIAALTAHIVSVFFLLVMTFLIRQISNTADGPEIVRARTVDKPELIVGRTAECDIHLQDLAVEPQHARIVQLGPHSIEVSTINGLGFEVDGRTTLRAAIDAAKGAELRFGGHRLTIGHEDDSISIAVQRVEALSDASEEKDEAQVFSLKGLMISKRIMAWTLAVAILFGFLALPIWGYASGGPDQRSIYGIKADRAWTPGPLSRAHHSLEARCEACHVKAFVSVRDTACLTCHKTVHDHGPPAKLAAARGEADFGGKLLARVAHAFGKPGQGCIDCHTEHESEGRMAPTAQAFCSDCHGRLKERVPDADVRDVSDFGTGHPEFMPAVMQVAGVKPNFARVSLADHPRDVGGLKFPHALHLSTTNGVARMAQTMRGQFDFGSALACKDCHTPTADGVRFMPVEMEKNCGMCHSLAFDRVGGTFRTLRHGDPRQVVADIRALYRSGAPERPVELGGMARRRPGLYAAGQVYSAYFGAAAVRPGQAESAVAAIFSRGGVCYDCHTITPPGGRGASEWTVTPVHQTMRYMSKGWFSHEAHKTESCTSCHAAGTSTSADQLLLPDIKSCRSCHGGEASNAKVPSSCALCHSYHFGTGAPWVSAIQVSRSRTGSDMTRAREKPGR